MSETEQPIRHFLIETQRWAGTPSALTTDFPLIDNEVLDSLGIFETIAFLEDHFAIRIEDDDLVPENFESLGAIARLVELRGS
jgi:acyl carrier protein